METLTVQKETTEAKSSWEISVKAEGVKLELTQNGRKSKKRFIPLAKCQNRDPEAEAIYQQKKFVSEGWVADDSLQVTTPDKADLLKGSEPKIPMPDVWF